MMPLQEKTAQQLAYEIAAADGRLPSQQTPEPEPEEAGETEAQRLAREIAEEEGRAERLADEILAERKDELIYEKPDPDTLKKMAEVEAGTWRPPQTIPEQIGEGLEAGAGWVTGPGEAGATLITGIPSFIAGFFADVGKGLVDVTKKAKAPPVVPITKALVDIWKTGGRDTQKLDEVIDTMAEARGWSAPVTEATTYKPVSPEAQLMTEVGLSPVTQWTVGWDKLAEATTSDPNQQKAIKMVGDFLLLIGGPKLAMKIIKQFGGRIKAKGGLAPEELSVIAEQTKREAPGVERRAPEMAGERTLFDEAMAERRRQPDYRPELEEATAKRMREDIRARYAEETKVEPTPKPTAAEIKAVAKDIVEPGGREFYKFLAKDDPQIYYDTMRESGGKGVAPPQKGEIAEWKTIPKKLRNEKSGVPADILAERLGYDHYSEYIEQFSKEKRVPTPEERALGEMEYYEAQAEEYNYLKSLEEAAEKEIEATGDFNRAKFSESDAGKVKEMYIETREAIKQKRRPSFKRAFQGAKRAMVDTSGNIKKKMLRELGDLGKEAVIEHDLIAGVGSKADRVYQEASNKIYKGLKKEELDLLDEAIQSRRTVAISKYKPDVKHPRGLTGEQHEAFLNTVPKNIMEKADLYFDEMVNQLDALKKEGLIDKASYDALKATGDYSPRRFIETIDPIRVYKIGQKTISIPDSGLKALEEGSYNVMEIKSQLLLPSIINRTQRRIFRNKANRALYQIAESIPDNGIVRIKTKPPAGHTSLSVVIDGKTKKMIMPDKWAREWVTRDPLITNQWANIVGWATGSKVLKAMATGYNPFFAFTNLPRDIAHIYLTTSEYSSFLPKFTAQMGKDLLTVAKDSFTRKGRWLDYIDEGGSMNFLTYQGWGKRVANPKLKTLQEVLGYVGETSEILTRLALRERALKQGKSPKEATWIARNYLDFSQGGNVAKAIDSAVPYFNASIQGTRGIFRALGDRPAQTLGKFGQIGALATGLYLANRYGNPECWDAVTDREKVGNFVVTTPFHVTDKNGNKRYMYFKVAKDQGQRVICSLFENIMGKMLGDEISANQAVISIQDFVPIIPTESLPPSLDAMIGYYANKDLWLNKDIWKGKDVPARKEFTLYTHPALVKAGEVTGMSPERLNYALGEFFTRGNIYTSLVSGGLNLALRQQPEQDKRKLTEEMVANLPGIRRVFKLTPPYNEKEIQDMKKAIKEENARQEEQRMGLQKMANEYYTKLNDDGVKDLELRRKIKSWIREQPKEDRTRLNNWFTRYGKVYAIPDKFWWFNLTDMQPEARAYVYFTKWLESSEEERKELRRIAKQIGGVWSDRFRARFNELRRKWEASQ